ncbi:pantoate--beta-alanine ligase [Salisediminibacterium halotolerans]|uniref:pantoate--beta-alanine ligase n=1 Tax=Salisediminibacterium halotolerans TaxID=517425 RepID=UPI000EB15D5C|nr:pantoate--beta-alanine ligase [Salisediminibacterium halotolerans]RLJ77913.1 pantothenate synthetase [Actinophytocola xinjiangensis]RPE88749.1 pantothenate synthetase [Salisediminibacterium halotolerans]TWG36890.1 pantothenate synthetase [Salisediminibacterium halotolerans]GEL07424.1 pantothenate synthetase [Salisediminibacterium halotolerans]
MKIIRTVKEMKIYCRKLHEDKKTIGFVPTMGYLHDGHVSLMNEARKHADCLIISSFVNPLQFGPDEDYSSYPRDEAKDVETAEKHGAEALFIPPVAEMYPSTLGTKVSVIEGTDVLCGESRPGHFDGVATVVLKLFEIIKPDIAVFGMKDAQQTAILKRMVEDFNLDVEIVPAPIVREADGLALSSRNVNLTPAERAEAPALYRILGEAKKLIEISELTAGEETEQWVINQLQQTLSAEIDYVQMLTFPELKPPASAEAEWIIAAAVQYQNTRLIDNITKS